MKNWKYSIGRFSSDYYNGDEFENRMHNLYIPDEDDYRDIILDIGNIDLYCKDLGIRTSWVMRWIIDKKSINYKDVAMLYGYMADHTICFYHMRTEQSPRKLISPEQLTRSIEWFIHEGLMSYEYISWGTHISENLLRQWIDEWDFRGLTYSKIKRVCDFILDRLDKNVLSEENDEVLILLP